MNFKELHKQEKPILICNVWDVVSAKAAVNLGYQVIGTSSGAIASMLGYEDGEEMSFSELEYIVKRISQSVKLPLSVDLEAGYSRNPDEIVTHIQSLSDLGVVGINIEDSLVENGNRTLLDADIFEKILNEVCSKLKNKGIEMYVNVRTDTFLLGCSNPVKETVTRAKKYQAAGADGLFVPCIVQEEDIQNLTKEIPLPLNVMCMPELPDFERLHNLGVKRISMGNFVFNKMEQQVKKELQHIQQSNSFTSLFA